ncbi:MAG: NAD+ synthase [Candidatus Levybacteria bacterium]|nr:NAD+ synthase [Candidatus Levybacteria bacterium]
MENANPEKIAQSLVKFLRETFKKTGLSYAVIGLSGGVDSSLSLTLTVRALGQNKVFPILLPYGKLNDQGVTDALEVIEALNIPKEHIIKFNIKTPVDEIAKIDPRIDMIRKGNIMARTRMTLLFDQAKKRKALVVGTENKSECLLGYFTRFGDEASDIEPLHNLYKTQVYQLAKFMNLPKSVLTKQPTAGLWENQTDENEFGFTYKDADKILYCYFDQKLSEEQIIAKGLTRTIVEKVLQFARKNNFKHNLPFVTGR